MFLPIDALTSSRAWERSVALNRMETNGAILTTYESAVFELLKDAKDEKFRDVLTIIKGSKRGDAIGHLWFMLVQFDHPVQYQICFESQHNKIIFYFQFLKH